MQNDFLKSEGYGRLFIHVHPEDNETIRKWLTFAVNPWKIKTEEKEIINRFRKLGAVYSTITEKDFDDCIS